MKVCVLQSNYFPWRGYFDLIRNVDLFVFYDEVKYTKNDWRNRNKISSENSTHWITIQVDKSSERIPINQVTLDYNPDWRKSHLSLLEFCYKKTPLYRQQLKPFVENCLLEYKTNYLSELNKYIIKSISQEAGFGSNFVESTDYKTKDGRIEKLLSLLQLVGCTEYVSGPAAKDYLVDYEDLFLKNGIKITYFSYPQYLNYGNDRSSYQAYLSILDFMAYEKLDNLKNFLKG